jgi:glycosyltransferase involved in cell wall biosynthesis
MPPLFSIVTVTLNSGDALKATAESVISQSYSDYEYIIKDGMSRDKSIDFLTDDPKFSTARLYCKYDNGIYHAMNQALEMCTGKYVLFLNAGDVFENNNVLARLSLECGHKVSPALIYTDYMTTGLMKIVRSPSRLTRRYLYRTMLCHQTCYIKRECYEKYGLFDLELRVVADYDFLLRLMIKAGASYKYIPFASVVSLSGGFSSENMDVALKEVRRLRKKYFTGGIACVYAFMYFMTLPWLRIYLMRKSKFGLYQKMYTTFVNSYYRLLK